MAAAVPQAEPQQQAEEEERQRGRKRRSARKPAGKRQAAAAADVEQSPAPQARRGSLAPAAAAQQLEMSLPPEGARAAAAGSSAAAAAAARRQDVDMVDAEEEAAAAAAARSRADPAAAAAGYLRRRLTQPRSEEAATMPLRPRLQVRGAPAVVCMHEPTAANCVVPACPAGHTCPTLVHVAGDALLAGGAPLAAAKPDRHSGAGPQQLAAHRGPPWLWKDAGACCICACPSLCRSFATCGTTVRSCVCHSWLLPCTPPAL